ncbi:MAG: hypothetical protein IKO00_08595 [Oscillospiraceae bacterium]|nr:hypothetical protein [Oscillospiraceae bacterium]
MRKKFFRIIALIIALTMLLSTAAFAAVNASAYINVTNAWITRDGNTVKVNFWIVGTDTMDKIGVKYIYLYEKTGNTWYWVKTFSYTDPLYPNMMDTNTSAHATYVTYSGSASKSYYADCRFYAEKDGGSDTIQQNTPTSHGTTPTP